MAPRIMFDNELMELNNELVKMSEMVEKAIADTNIYTPPQYGNIRSFKERWLKKFKCLGIQPVVIPDSMGIDEIPSIYDLLIKESENDYE